MTPDEKKQRIINFFKDQLSRSKEHFKDRLLTDVDEEIICSLAFISQMYPEVIKNIEDSIYFTARIALELILYILKCVRLAECQESTEFIVTETYTIFLDGKNVEQLIEEVQGFINDLMSLISFSDIPANS